MDDSLYLISPCIAPSDKSEAEIFGAMTWLWMQSNTHRQCPLYELQRLLMPALQTGQYALAVQDNDLQNPVGLVTWAKFDAEMEQRYLQSLDRTLQPTDWQSGDRPWVLDWVVPFGHTHAMVKALRHQIPAALCRGLYHKGDQTGLKVLYFRGKGVSKAQEADFWAQRPLPERQQKQQA